jgi:calcyclin binding protein
MAKATEPSPEPLVAASAPAAAAARSDLSYATLGSFSWEQDNEKIRVRCYSFLLEPSISFLPIV